jgi:hypothetical protein
VPGRALDLERGPGVCAAEAVSAADAATAQPRTSDEVRAIASSQNVLDRFASTMRDLGVVGEERLAKLLYLAVTSRLLAQPVSVAVKGPSSGGKSYSVGKVLLFFPAEAYYELSAMSEKALVYSEEPLTHRFLVICEAAGMKGEFAEYLVRSLLSEGRLRYETVEKTAGGALESRLIEREGPTGLIVTTTLASMHPENETRYVSVTVADTPEQTEHILMSMAREATTSTVDLSAWRDFQRALESGPRNVVIPFAETLVTLIPPVAVRLRRDFGKLLTLIRTHALIHQETRALDDLGRLVAEPDDYAAVYELVADLIAAGVEATVPPQVRETVETVARLLDAQNRAPAYVEPGVSSKDVADALILDKTAAWRRVNVARHLGYLENLEARRGKRARLILGDPLPEDRTILPTPDELCAAINGCTVAAPDEGTTEEAAAVAHAA